jgi:glycosyltransferase involved in cell wall biosynthesis
LNAKADVRSEEVHLGPRVLVVVRHPVGGVRTHILYTYPTLLQAGYRFTFVIPESEYHAPFCEDVAGWPAVEVVQVPHRDASRQKPRFWSAIRNLLKRKTFSLIHSHGVQAAIPTLLANFRARLPHLMTSQDVFCRVNLPGIKGRLKLRGLAQLLRRLDVLIAVSEDTRQDHLQYLPGLKNGPCRVEVIPNGIDLDRYSTGRDHSSSSLRRELGIQQDCFLVGFLGRFMPQKGFLDLVEGLQKLIVSGETTRPIHLLAVGSGDCLVNYRWELDRYPQVKERITFREHVSNVAPLLRELDLLAMPSLWEACPILPMEAMCLGVPVLGSDCIGLREVLRDTPSEMVPAGDPAALAAALQHAMDFSRRSAAEAFIPTARQRFDVRPVGGVLARLYDSLCGTNPC